MSEKGPTIGIALAFNLKSTKWLDITPWLESCRKDKYQNPASDEKPETESRSETPNPPTSHIRAHPNGRLGGSKCKSTCNFTSKAENLKLTSAQ